MGISKQLPLLAFIAGLAYTPAADAVGKYERRRAKRGEVTDTNAKVTRWSFINDLEETPRRLAFFVDAAPARQEREPDLLIVRGAIAFRGQGPPVIVGRRLFELRWPGAAQPVSPVTAAQLHRRLSDVQRRRAFWRASSFFPTSPPFGRQARYPVRTRFYTPAPGADPIPLAVLEERGVLSDTLIFELPPGVDRWQTLFEIALIDPLTGEDVVDVRFRVEPSAMTHRNAFRRARKARRAENRRAGRVERWTTEESPVVEAMPD